MSIPSAFASHADAHKAGWFSRRHQTNEAHRANQDARLADEASKREREEWARTAAEERKAEARRVKVA